MNVVTRILGRFVGQASRKISKDYSESILMKVSDVLMGTFNEKNCARG